MRSMTAIACVASSDSTSDTGRPAPRSAPTNWTCRSIKPSAGMSGPASAAQPEFFGGTGLVGSVLEDHAESRGDGGLIELVGVERDEGAGPVDRLGDARRLLQLERTQGA